MGTLTKRPLALADLAEIWSFIADDSESNADRFLSKLETNLKRLATQPLTGHSRHELMPALRCIPYARYVVFYLPQPDGIEIVRVLHSARDITAEYLESESNS